MTFQKLLRSENFKSADIFMLMKRRFFKKQKDENTDIHHHSFVAFLLRSNMSRISEH